MFFSVKTGQFTRLILSVSGNMALLFLYSESYAVAVAPFSFNPRSREGSDILVNQSTGEVHVSIHAPVKGATSDNVPAWFARICFNPRSREGSDLQRLEAAGEHSAFQSTLP